MGERFSVQCIKIIVFYGMDLEYENFGSEGEKIVVLGGLMRIVIQEGRIFFDYSGVGFTCPDNPEGHKKVLKELENSCESETESIS